MTGFEYGNTRLRAMRSRMLGDDDYRRMVRAGTLERLLGILADSDYSQDVETAITRYRGLRRLDAVVRFHLTRVLRAMRTFYEAPITDHIDVLLQRWDAKNLILLLHAHARPDVGGEALELLVPVGSLDDAALSELAAQPGPRAVLDLLVAWGLPNPETARRLVRAWPEYELSGDLAVLNRAVMASLGAFYDNALKHADTPLARVLRAELDASNVLTALRLRSGRLADEVPPDGFVAEDSFVPGGTITTNLLLDIVATDEADAVAEYALRHHVLPDWEPAMRRWAESGDMVALADELDRATSRYATRLLTVGDPLSLDIPVGFTAAQEREARNVRWIGRGIVHGFSPEEIEAGVVVA